MDSITDLAPEIQKRISDFKHFLCKENLKRPEVKFIGAILASMLKVHHVQLATLARGLGELLTKLWQKWRFVMVSRFLYWLLGFFSETQIWFCNSHFINSPLSPLSITREGMTTQPVPPLLQGKRGGQGVSSGLRWWENSENITLYLSFSFNWKINFKSKNAF